MLTILFVEDDPDMREYLPLILTEIGRRILVAGNGQEAFQCYAGHSSEINLVISDYRMPVTDGMELFEKLKECYGGARPPFILMSADLAAGPLRVKAQQAGVDYLLEKPFGISELEGAIEETLGRGKS